MFGKKFVSSLTVIAGLAMTGEEEEDDSNEDGK